MNWQEVCADRNLTDLPYKIELNERGQILMGPARLLHSGYQAKIIKILIKLVDYGEVIPEFAIGTTKGTKVPDIVWCSKGLWDQVKFQPESTIAPQICIEVLSPNNTDQEMEEKKHLYFEQGAKEVWICNEQGEMKFFNPREVIDPSQEIPAFPNHIEI